MKKLFALLMFLGALTFGIVSESFAQGEGQTAATPVAETS
jgi:hypothetical protein